MCVAKLSKMCLKILLVVVVLQQMIRRLRKSGSVFWECWKSGEENEGLFWLFSSSGINYYFYFGDVYNPQRQRNYKIESGDSGLTRRASSPERTTFTKTLR